MKTSTTLFLFLILVQSAFTQSLDIQWYGYVHYGATFDSRQIVAFRENHFLLYPAPQRLDKDGKDINAEPQLNFAVLQTRFGSRLSGPEFIGAKSSALMEAEFLGNSESDVNGLRIRHAYVNLDWKDFELLVGQAWTVLYQPEAAPQVVASNGGAPFLPFGRHPQIRFTANVDNVKLIAALQMQRDYSSSGPLGTSNVYMRNGLLPELIFQIQYRSGGLFLGGGAEYKSLRPRQTTTKNIVTTERVNSYAFNGYVKLPIGDVTARFNAAYGGNMSDVTMIGGYAVTGLDTVTGIETYSPVKTLSLAADLSYGKELELGLFFGYTKNLGADENYAGAFFGRNNDIDAAFRISPRIQLSQGKTRFSLELEHTSAAYGATDAQGKVSNTKQYANTRVNFAAYYFF
ncbi:hypothetical protein ANRL3_02162 [Anaerolineae bacterium]|nr:hypothetical protein ANRL3_02162 [Anaerolineae bacterium]